jgi:hypothetical protein
MHLGIAYVTLAFVTFEVEASPDSAKLVLGSGDNCLNIFGVFYAPQCISGPQLRMEARFVHLPVLRSTLLAYLCVPH